MTQLSRRGFFLSWLLGLLAGWLGRSQTPAAASALNPNPSRPAPAKRDTQVIATVSDGVSSSSHSVTWHIAPLPPAGLGDASPPIPVSDGTAPSGPSFTWTIRPAASILLTSRGDHLP